MPGYVVMNIIGMTGAKCEETIKNAILKCKGVEYAKACYKESSAATKVDMFGVDINELKDVVESVGFKVNAMYFNTEL